MKITGTRIGSMVAMCLPAIVYLMWIEVYYWLLGGRRYQAFMQPKLWPLLILALTLLLIFIASLISRFSWQQKDFGQTIRALVLFVPVVFIWTVYGQSLGVDAFSQKAFSVERMTSIPGRLPKQPPSALAAEHAVSLLSLVKNPAAFNGKHIATEGIVYRDPQLADNAFRLFRFVIICCAADALPISVRVEGDRGKPFKNDTWVRVEGQVYVDKTAERPRPGIVAEVIQPIRQPPPEKRYLFFRIDE